MKTRYMVALVGSVIGVSVFVGIIMMLPNHSGSVYVEDPFRQEHYEIKITGMKDVYLVGEPYSFSYILSGYGNLCGSTKVMFPDQNGNTKGKVIHTDCVANAPKKDFVWDAQKKRGTTYGHVGIMHPGRFPVSVEFGNSGNFEPTQAGHTFFVVENVCDQQDPKERAHCFVDSYNSCMSSFAKFAHPTGEGDGIIVTGIVESWNDCALRVFVDHTRDRHMREVYETRSICGSITLDKEAVMFEDCTNTGIPPLRYDQQHYLHMEECEIYGGNWNFEFNSCFDFSDEYDCEEMGGELVSRAYTGEQPDYSKKSDSFVCKFGK